MRALHRLWGLSAIAFTVASTLGCGASTQRVATVTEAEKGPRRPLFLWRVSSAGVPPTYLFGTCHAGVTLDRMLPRDQRAALDDARVVALEVDGESVMDPRSLVASTLLPDGVSLRALLGERDWTELTHQFPNGGLHWMALDRFHPFLMTAMLSLAASGAAQATRRDDGIEPTIVRRSRARGVRVTGLETVQDQIRIMTSGPPSASIPELRATLAHPNAAGRSLRGMFFACAWGYDEVITRMSSGAPDEIFARRNAAWLPRIESLVHEGGAFIAVGAGHLVGTGGLIATLEQRGYHVERLSSTAEDDPDFQMSLTSSGGASSGPRSASPAPAEASNRPESEPSVAPGAGAPPWVTEYFAPRFSAAMCGMPATTTCIASDPNACASRYQLAVR